MPSGVPRTVHHAPIPRRFRSWTLHLEDPVVVLREFIRWLEDVSERQDGAGLDRLEAELADLGARAGRLEHDRKDLVVGLVELIDLLDSPALRRRAIDTLAAAGVEAVDSAGDQFDPARHRAVARVETADPAADGIIVETERLGYVDGGRHVRLPDVHVYHHADG
jgi:hypothetical protein